MKSFVVEGQSTPVKIEIGVGATLEQVAGRAYSAAIRYASPHRFNDGTALSIRQQPAPTGRLLGAYWEPAVFVEGK